MNPATIAAFGVSLAVQPAAVWLLRRREVLDHPNQRSSHSVPTPRGGGIVVVLGMLVGLAVGVLAGVEVTFLVVSVLLFALIGAYEDFRGIPALRRLPVQLLAGVVAGALTVGALTGVAAWLIIPLAVWIAGYANAFNFMDGINGISAFSAIVAGIAFAWIGNDLGSSILQLGGAVLAATSLGFVPWNAFRAVVFLGDVGSYALGATIALLSAYAVFMGAPPEAALAPLAVYLVDTTWTLLRRVWAGETWYEAHHMHVYQRLIDLGWSHPRVAGVVGVITAALATLAVWASSSLVIHRAALDAVMLALLTGYLALPAWVKAIEGRKARSCG